MTRAEYDRIQAALLDEMNGNLWVKHGYSGVRADGFRSGVMAAMQIVCKEFQSKKKKGETKNE